MDEWGTSVWDTPIDTLSSRPVAALTPPQFSVPLETKQVLPEEFDDFGEASQPAPDDDFDNDFGDFDDGQVDAHNFDGDADLGGFGEASQAVDLPHRQPATWEPLRLRPLPPPADLAEDVQEILAPMWAHSRPEELMTQEKIRQVEGLGQMLVTPDSRTLYQTLFSVPPAAATYAPNWTRSRIRRQQLIALGIPINLDEVMPHSNGKPLPALNITTRPSSAPPGPQTTPPSVPPSGSGVRDASPQKAAVGVHSPPAGLGPKPKLDDAKIAQMLDLDTESLNLLPLLTLETHLDTLRILVKDTSALLSHLLQTREALQQDSETYNGLIAELVSEAQKLKTGTKSKTGTVKRGSGVA